MVDPGREFMGNVTKLMEQHKVKIQRGQAGNHRSQAFVERANKTLSERLFSHQYAQEMVTDGRSREWVKRLPQVLKAMNSEPTRLIGKEPSGAIGVHYLSRSVVSSDQPVLYYLSEGAPKRGFIREELLVIPSDTELPPKGVLK